MGRKVRRGGGWAAVRYTFAKARQVGLWRLWKAMSSRNACKTCALGMGGQLGGMRNEAGHWPEVCKKSLQAMVADMQNGIQPEFFERYSVDHLRTFSPRELETSGRLVSPLWLRRGERHYRPIEWEQALGLLATKIAGTEPERSFFYFSGRSSNEAAFLLQLFARLYGANNVNNCSYYCHQASGVGLSRSLGTGTATVVLEDVEKADLVLLIGGNPASNHPRLMRSLMTVRRNGGKVIVVNPVVETGLVNFSVPSDVRSLLFGSPIASLYVQPHIGGDAALLTGVAKCVLDRGAVDRNFIAQATEGFDAFEKSARDASWKQIVEDSGVDRATIEQIADLYVAARNVVFAWTMGVTHHEHGVINVERIVDLALLRGMAGKPHAGLLPIRGHSNVQGIGSMGVTPTLKDAVFRRLESHFGVQLPTKPGLDTFGCIEAAERGEIDVGWCLGGNLFGSNPDSKTAHRSLSKVGLVAYMSTTLNTGHAWGLGQETLILPVLARDEEPQTTTQESMFNYVRISDGGRPRHAGPRSEVSVIAAVARRVLDGKVPVDWSGLEEHAAIRQAIAAVIPGYEAVADVDGKKQEFQIPGRTFHAPKFATASGKAHFSSHPLPKLPALAGKLRLMTVRSEGQFNTVVYEEEDLYRGQERRDVVLMNADDMKRMGLQPDQPVVVRSSVGEMVGVLARPFEIRAGNCLMYYPEANVLVPGLLDPASRTPSFKSILVTIEPPSFNQSFVSSDQLLAAAKS